MRILREHQQDVNDLDVIPFGGGDESHGCTAGFADADAPEDKGSSEPQPFIESGGDMEALRMTMAECRDKVLAATRGLSVRDVRIERTHVLTARGFQSRWQVAIYYRDGRCHLGEDVEVETAERLALLKASIDMVRAERTAANVVS